MKTLKNLKTFENFDVRKQDAAENIADLAKELGINVTPENVEDFVENIAGPDLQALAKADIKEEEPIEEPVAENVNESFLDILSQWWSEIGNYQHTTFSSGVLTMGLTIALLVVASAGGMWLTTKAEVKKMIIKEAERIAKQKGLDKTQMPDALFKKAIKDIVNELRADEVFMAKVKKSV
jgi:hypothetical protein